MPRYRMNYGITDADSALMFEFFEATNRAGRPLGQFLTTSPSQDMPEGERIEEYAEVRRRIGQTMRRHDQPAIAAFVAEKKLHDPQQAGLHFHTLGAWARHISETLARSITGATATRVPRQNGTWISKNERLNVQIEPNRGPNGIFDRCRYLLKQSSEERHLRLIDNGMIDEGWGEVWAWETPGQIGIDRLILSRDAWALILRDRDSRSKVYLPPTAPIEPTPVAPPAPEPLPPPPKLQIVVSNSTPADLFQLSLFSDENRIPQLADFGGGVMPSEVAQEIERLRRQRGMTQQQLADACMIARPTLANACNGRYPLGEWPTARLREFLLQPLMAA